jgi:predicted phage terminase large subunit-like protein
VARAPELQRVVVAVDPSASASATSDECGIVVAGISRCACRGTEERHMFVLADVSAVLSPAGWAAAVRRAYDSHGADRVVAEKNQGGEMVATVLRAHGGDHLPITLVTASRGKQVRAEPVAALVEQHKIHFVGCHSHLEDQCCEWDPVTDRHSPDRLDAFVWAASELMLGAVVPRYKARAGQPIRPRRM